MQTRAILTSLWLCLASHSAACQSDVLVPSPQATPAAGATYDRPGIRRDTLYYLGYQFAAAGVIAIAQQGEDNPSKKTGLDGWWHNVTHPRWDPDRAVVNYVLHPYWGAAYYIRARERGLERQQAFWYSVLLSTMFEFGAEAMVEPVSYQDLVVTPVLGSLLGEYVFAPARAQILAKPGPRSVTDSVLLVLTDPLDAINTSVGRLLGIETELMAGPMLPKAGWGGRGFATSTAFPLQGHRAAPRRGWGVMLSARW